MTNRHEERRSKDVDRTVGVRARERRLDIGMSQERLAELLGVTFQQVQKYEKGINRIAASRLWDLSRALNVDVGYFFEGLAGANGPAAANQDAPTVEGIRAMRLINAQSPRVRARLVGLIETVATETKA